MKKLTLCIAALLVTGAAFGQAEKIKEALKMAKGETPDFAAAIRTIDEALANPETQNSAEAWYTKGQIYQKQYDFEDDKRFQVPPQAPDVNAQSEAAYKAYKTWMVADSLDEVESQTNPKRKGKMKYRSDIAKFVWKTKDFASNYGAMKFQEGNAMEANEIFADITNMPKQKMFTGFEKMNANDSTFIFSQQNYKLTAINVYNKYIQAEDTLKAEQYAKQMSAQFPEDPTFMTWTLQHDLWAGRNAQAEKKLNQAIEMSPNNYIYYLVRANIYGLNRATRSKAEPDYQKAMELAPEAAKYNVVLAYGDYKKNMGDDAYDFAVDNERKNPVAAAKSNDDFVAAYEEAEKLLEEARAMKSPADDSLLNELQMMYAKLRSFYYSKKNDQKYNEFDKKMKAIRTARGL